MNTASPTIEKESFFECNHIRKKFWASYSSQDLDFFFLRQPALGRPNGRPSLGHQILMSKFQTFLKVFEKNDEKVILMSTNIIIGQLNINDYEYDDGVTIFWLCENLQAHFHFRLFDPWHDKRSDIRDLLQWNISIFIQIYLQTIWYSSNNLERRFTFYDNAQLRIRSYENILVQ